MAEDKIRINLRGTIFAIKKSSISKSPVSRLAHLTESLDEYDALNNEYFFDRNPFLFQFILDYNATGELHFPSNICFSSLRREMEFWEIVQSSLSPCCWKTLYSSTDDLKIYTKMSVLESQNINDSGCLIDGQTVAVQSKTRWKIKLRKFLTDPNSSRSAKIWFYLMLFVTLASLITFGLTSKSDFRELRPKEDIEHLALNTSSVPAKVRGYMMTKTKPVLKHMTIIINVVFFFDIVLRVLSIPSLKLFVKDFLNITEIVAILASAVMVVLEEKLLKTFSSDQLQVLLVVFGILMTARVFRVLRVAENSKEAKILKLCLIASAKELGFLVMILGTFSFISGALVFNAEMSVNDTFPDYFVSVWWAIITMTSVGYGDYYPKSMQGYLVGVVTAVFGILLSALPIAVIASNFSEYYSCYNIKQKHDEIIKCKQNQSK